MFLFIVNGKLISDIEFVLLIDEQWEGFYIFIDELENRLSESLLSFFMWKCENLECLCDFDKKIVEQGIKLLLKVFEYKYVFELGVMKYFKQLKIVLVNVILVIYSEEQKEEKSDDFDKKVFLEE